MDSTKVLTILAEHLGTEEEDISKSDSFTEDLRMGSIELSDFAQALESAGYPINPENISNFETVDELLEFINQEDSI